MGLREDVVVVERRDLERCGQDYEVRTCVMGTAFPGPKLERAGDNSDDLSNHVIGFSKDQP